jgi:hypothetical protein
LTPRPADPNAEVETVREGAGAEARPEDADPRDADTAVSGALAAESRPRSWLRPGLLGSDLLALLVYLGGALWVTARGWVDPGGRLLGHRPDDQGFNEWMLAHAAHVTTHLDNPFFTTLQNAPAGVNLVGNVGLQLPGILLTPITLLGGASLSYLVFVTFNLVATASAWYWVLSRHLVASRGAAFFGGLFCGFAPAMVAQSSGHPHITAQWLVPFIVWRVVLLTRGAGPLRNGLILGGLMAAQFFVSLEILFMLAIGCAMAAIGYAVLRPRAALRAVPRALGTLAVAAALVLAIAAYPLWMMFWGPQHRVGHPGDADVYTLKLGAFVAYATESLGGSLTSAKGLASHPTEESAFYGWPVLVLVFAAVAWLRREAGVLILAGCGVLSALLSLGTTLSWGARRTDVPGPFALVQDLPIFDTLVIARFALITTVAIGLLLAIALDRIAALAPRFATAPVWSIAVVAVVAALLPTAPTPLPAKGRVEVPTFISSGQWREYVAEGHTLVPAPVNNMTSLYWGASSLTGFAVPQGYFLGPTSPTDDTARWFVVPQHTALLLTAVAAGDRPPTVTVGEREQAVADVRYWKADAVVLPQGIRRATELRTVLDAFYGPAKPVGDVWVWDVRPLVR